MPLFPKYEGPILIDRVIDVENLTLAWRRVRSNIQVARRQRSSGVDDVTLRDFEADWAAQMSQLADELRSGVYRPLPARSVRIPKASGGERAIAILAVRDRIAQRAVQQVLEPLFDPYFLDCSYGCRPYVGVPGAVERVGRYAAQGMQWVVDADVASYFDSIDHRVLLSLVRQRIAEPAILRLIWQWLAAGSLQPHEPVSISAEAQTPLEHGAVALRGLLDKAATMTGLGQAPLTPAPMLDPYAAAAWEQPAGISYNQPYSQPWKQPSTAEGLWAMLMLAQPVLQGAQRALPYVQRIGGRKLAIAGAVAAGTMAVSELLARTLADTGRGTPQGGSLSPLLANIYLHPFDVALTSQGIRLVRFVDDFVIMCPSRPEAEQALDLARRQLTILRLTLNSDKTRIIDYGDGVEFLGQALAPRRQGPQLEHGLRNFQEAEQALKQATAKLRKRVKG